MAEKRNLSLVNSKLAAARWHVPGVSAFKKPEPAALDERLDLLAEMLR